MESIDMEIYFFLIVISFKMGSLNKMWIRFKMIRLFLTIMSMIVCLMTIKVLMIRKVKVRKIKKQIFDPHYFIVSQKLHIRFAITAHYIPDIQNPRYSSNNQEYENRTFKHII